MNELISIIVPIYNVHKYLKKCVNSIINQTYTNLEIILVDDGSIDNCGIICDEYAKKDKRIKVIHKENGGLSDARNAGLEIANGKYVSFIDSDDYVSKNFIKKLYECCKKYNCDMAEANFIKIEKEIELEEKEKFESRVIDNKEMLERLYILQDGINIRTVVVWNKLYKRKIVDKCKFPKGKIHEDEFFTYKVLYENNIKIAILDEILYYYRIRPGSITNQKFKISKLDAIEALEERIEYFKVKGEKKLYELTLNAYQLLLLRLLNLLKNDKCKNREIKSDLIHKFRSNYKKIKKTKNISNKEKVKYILAYISPNLYFFIKKIKF